MTKRDIIQRCHEKDHDFSKALTEKVLNFILEEIVLSLSKGEKVKLSGFGTWSIKKTSKKVGVKFKPSKKLLY
ncbi:HU family DNA-binding protein, partial [Thermocrinis sp.]|uniref:HU family DNA-binding protein n=1 Tax=Thermocrinis sp. TaxID=2024383 RepID=UPI003C11B15C